MSITFDPSISLGSIITVIVFLITVMGAAMNFSARLTKIELKVDTMWKAWLAETLKTHGGGIDAGCG